MLYVWGIAGLVGAEVLLRLEDHDRQRCRVEYEAALLRDLRWLGFEPANEVEGSPSPYRQSDCGGVYAGALGHLATQAPVYRCTCTRRTLRALQADPAAGEIRYPGLCRGRRRPSSESHGLRVAWDASDPPETFTDGLLGRQVQRPERQCGDLLVRDRLGQWTYQYSVTVDDVRHGVDLVVRGEDLLASTGRQIRLARLLGRHRPPLYVHHPLAVDSSGEKLSKRRRTPSIRRLRSAGRGPGAVLGKAAVAVGLLARARNLRPADASELVAGCHGWEAAPPGFRAPA